MTDTAFCRLCAEIRPTSDLVILDQDELSINLNLYDKIYKCFQIQIEKNDKLPKCVCSECCQQVVSTYEFSEKIQRAQIFLNSLFNQSYEEIKTECNNESGDYPSTVHVKIEKDANYEKYGNDERDDNDGNDENAENEELSDHSYKDDAKSNWTSDNDDPISALLSSTKKKKKKKKQGRPKIEKTKSPKKKYKKKKNVELSDARMEELRQKKQIMEQWEGYQWKCNVCPSDFISVQELREHYNSEHKIAPQYVCVECSKVYESYGGFRQHVNNHRNQFRFCCPICGKYANRKALLDRHLVTHSDVRKFTCSVCGKNFKTRNSLYSHGRIVHLSGKLKPVRLVECDICQKKFTSTYIGTHKEGHAGIRPFVCEYCGFAFHLRINLSQHILRKHKEDSCVCTVCSKSFKSMYDLKRHQKIHFETPAYKCDKCEKVFRERRALVTHEQVHMEHRLLIHECKICKKGFTRKQYLKRHLRQHTGDMPYCCKKCDHHFSCYSNFSKHLKRRHGLEKVSTANNQHEYPFN